MCQPCLLGLACRDMVASSEADSLEIGGDHACNSDDDWCGSPYLSESAFAEWKECTDPEKLDFIEPQGLPSLPPCVPNLMAREKVGAFDSRLMLATKATNIGGILSSNNAKLLAWRTRYGISNRCWLLIHQESRDQYQERLAMLTPNPHFFDNLRSLGKRVIFVTPGFSVYDDGTMCPLRQVLNIRRSLLEAARANRNGYASVPTIGWNSNRQSDLVFLSNWASRQTHLLTTLAVNAQTGTATDSLTIELGKGMAEIERRSDRTFQWIVFGGRRRIEVLAESIPRERMIQVARIKDFQVPVVSKTGRQHVQLQLMTASG